MYSYIITCVVITASTYSIMVELNTYTYIYIIYIYLNAFPCGRTKNLLTHSMQTSNTVDPLSISANKDGQRPTHLYTN